MFSLCFKQEAMPKNVVTSKLGGGDAYEDKTAPKLKKHAYEKKNVAFTRSRGPSTSTFRKRIISTKVRKRTLSGTLSPLSDLLSPLRIREPSKHPRPIARRPSVNELTARASRASRYQSIIRDRKFIVGVAAKLPATPSEPKVRPKSQRQRAQKNLPRPIIRRFSQNTNESFEYKGKWNQCRDVAVKMQKPEAVKTSAFLDEAQILKTLQHTNIVTLLAVCSETEPVYLVTEYMANGRLSLRLREGKGRDLKVSQLMWIAVQIADSMAYMEKEKCIHRNLGARNILVGEQNKVKIAGFGMTKCADDPDFNFIRGLKMAIKWMAPEVLLDNKYSTKADVWSFGILLLEIFTQGKEPYDGMASKKASEHVQHGYRMPKPELCPTEVYDVVLTCWSLRHQSRPSFDVLSTFLHDWQAPS